MSVVEQVKQYFCLFFIKKYRKFCNSSAQHKWRGWGGKLQQKGKRGKRMMGKIKGERESKDCNKNVVLSLFYKQCSDPSQMQAFSFLFYIIYECFSGLLNKKEFYRLAQSWSLQPCGVSNFLPLNQAQFVQINSQTRPHYSMKLPVGAIASPQEQISEA